MKQEKYATYTAFSDGTHIHENNPFKYCSQKHAKRLPEWAKFLIITQALLIVFLISTFLTHIILKANNL